MSAALSKSRACMDDKTMVVDVRLATHESLCDADRDKLVNVARDVWRECLPRARRSSGRLRRWVSGKKKPKGKAKGLRRTSEKAWLAGRRRKLAVAIGKEHGCRDADDVILAAKHRSEDAWTEKHEKAMLLLCGCWGLVNLTLQAAATLKQKAQKRNFDQMLQNSVPGDDSVPAELVEHRKNLRKNEVEGVRKWMKVQRARSAVVACSAKALLLCQLE